MYQAVIRNYLGADYTFNSASFKWVYYMALHFARQAIYLHPWLECIIIRFSNDVVIAVSKTGHMIDTKYKVMDIQKGE